MKIKIVNIFIILVMALSSVATVTAAAPSASGGPDSKYGLTDASSQVVGEIADDTKPARYIIYLPDDPLATYTGGTAGLDATAPRETGQKLSLESADVVAYQEYLKDQQTNYIAEVKAQLHRSPEVLFQYQYAANGVAMILTPSEAAILANEEDVRVFRAPVETPDTDTGPWLIGADAIWDGDTASGDEAKGEGIIVGIIDTGINFDHPSFSDTPADGYVFPTPAQYYGVCDPTNTEQYDANYLAACNDKLIGAFTFVRGDPDESETPEDSEGHGSHTASTVAGNMVDVTYQGVATTISGVAPHAQIISFDVCVPTPPDGACYGDATVEAVDAALETGVDVINYSISGGSNPYNDPVELAFLSATEAGIFVSTSAGNAGDTTGYSSVAHRSPWVSTVAASTHSRIFALEIDVAGPGAVPPELIGLGAVPSGAPLASTITASPIKYDPANLDGCDPFAASFFDGYIALIKRGSCNFVDKTAHAYAAGADYVIVYNSRTGPPLGMPVPETSSMLSLEDGEAVKDWIDANPTATVTIHTDVTKVINTAWEDIIAAFSSLGPNTTFDVLKPDITAPGVNILAAVADDTIAPSGDYELDLYQGTSMSSPHVAGSAALLMSLHPDWTPAEIKSAMMLTAEDGLRADRSALGEGVRTANPQDEGSGRVALEVTGLTGLVMDETIENYEAADPALGGDPSTLNMASLYSSKCVGTCSWTRTLTSVAGLPATYTVTAPTWITVAPTSFTINPGASQELTFTADVSAFDTDEWQYASIEFNTDNLHPGGSSTVVLSQDFTEETFPPTGWSAYDVDGVGTSWVRNSAVYYTSAGSAMHTYSSAEVQEGWLVTPLVSIPASGITTFNFHEAGQWTSYMAYHGIWVSTGSVVPTDGDYVELSTLAAPPELEWTTSPTMVDLSGYAGQDVYVAFVYAGYDADTWWVDDVDVLNTPIGAPISDVHIPAAVLPTTSNLPGSVVFETHRDAGGGPITDIIGAEITDLTVDLYGFVKGETTNLSLPEDPTNGDIYGDLTEVYYTLIPMDEGAARLVAEITASTAPDVDLFWGFDYNGDGQPSEDEEYGRSATGTAYEYLSEVWFPVSSYDVWVLVQNWDGSGAPEDDITLSIGVVPYEPMDPPTMTVNGPDTNPALTPFELEVLWHDIDTVPGDRLYGLFDVYDNASYDVELGYTQVDVIRSIDDVAKTVDLATAEPGDSLTYTIEITNFETDPVDYTLNDILPAGVTYVPGSVTGGAAYDGGTNAITWAGAVDSSVRGYVASTSATDALCSMPLATSGGYVDLKAYGLNPQASIFGEGTWLMTVPGNPINFYGQDVGNSIRFTDDGYAYMEALGTKPLVNADIPTADAPNHLLAFFWRDLEITYEVSAGPPPVIKGVSLANLTSGGIPVGHIIEMDDVNVKGNSAQTYDTEMFISKAYDDTAGEYEVVFAYDNIVGPLDIGTIGIEDGTGANGIKYAYNDAPLAAITNGLAICFDWTLVPAPPKVITFQVTVNSGFRGTITNDALHDNNSLGTLEEVAKAVTVVGNTPPVAVDDAYEMFEDGHLFVPAPGVLFNDSDANGDSLTAVLVDGPAHGMLSFNLDGSFNYSPDDDYFGTDTFTYKANDGIDDSNEVTVTITIIDMIDFFLPVIRK